MGRTAGPEGIDISIYLRLHVCLSVCLFVCLLASNNRLSIQHQEVDRFRIELEAITSVLKELQRRGVHIPLP
jgi:hypothetical protein